MIYNLFTKFEFKDICINGSAKKLSSPIPQNTEVCGGVEEKIYRKIFSPSPISMKSSVWHPCFGKYSPIVYIPPHLIATGNAKPHPLLKNISHLYARKSGFRDHVSIRIYIMFTNIPSPIRTKNSRFIGLSLICLHFVYVLGALSLT